MSRLPSISDAVAFLNATLGRSFVAMGAGVVVVWAGYAILRSLGWGGLLMLLPLHRLRPLARAIDRVHALLGKAVSWLVLVMVLVGAFNALARYGGKWADVSLSSNGWLEAQWYLFSLVFLLAAPDALRRDAHVRVDVLYGKRTTAAQRAVDHWGAIFLLIPFCVFGVLSSLPSVQASIDVREMSPDPGGLPRWPLKAVVPVAFGLLGLQGLSQAIKASCGENAKPFDEEAA